MDGTYLHDLHTHPLDLAQSSMLEPHRLEEDPFASSASKASSVYDFGEDSIDDAILACNDDNSGGHNAGHNVETISHASSDYDMGDESIDDAILAWEPRETPQWPRTPNTERETEGHEAHLPTPPPSKATNSPRGMSQSLFDVPRSPMASAFRSSVHLKRKAKDETDVSAVRRKPPGPPQTLLMNDPVVKGFSGLIASVFAQLPFAVHYDLARRVGNGNLKYEAIASAVPEIMQLKELKTNVAAMAQLEKILPKLIAVGGAKEDVEDDKSLPVDEKESKARDPCPELDLEKHALDTSPYGCMGYEKDGTPSSWYGGKVQLRGTLVIQDGSSDVQLRLERLTLGSSTQLTRRFGSRHLFRVKLPDSSKLSKVGSKVLDYCKRPIILCGLVYRAFYAKEDAVFFLQTDEVWDSGGRRLTGERRGGGMSLIEFLRWFNPPELNGGQAMAKWVSRLALTLSNSVPGFLPLKKNVKFIHDIVNPVTGANMTDGAGTMNRALRQQLENHHSKQSIYAVQIRAHGAKGLLTEDVQDLSTEPTLSLTPSQIKVKYPPEDEDPSHIAIDLLRTSHIRVGNQISAELIVNISENGVPLSSFASLVKTGFEALVDPYLDWSSDKYSLMRLWKHVATERGVTAARLARENPGAARAKGYNNGAVHEHEIDDGEDLADPTDSSHRASRWWPDIVSGQPASLPETIVALLDAGYTPGTCPVLREKLRMVLVDTARRGMEAMKVLVPKSAGAHIAPDRSGRLKENEISVRSSKCSFQRPDGSMANILVGDVLVGRYPCKVSTDVRKFKAVDIPQLDSLRDMIVLSTEGARRAADWLGGGDYDGDKAIVIWQPELVEPFENAPECYADPPEDMAQYVERDVEKTSDFFKHIESLSEAEAMSRFQDRALAPLSTCADVGAYSVCHERAVYKLGYSHPTTRLLASKFCVVMDASKSGLRVKKAVRESDMRMFNVAPAWKGTSSLFNETNLCSLKRNPGLGSFIMDDLSKIVKDQGDVQLARIEKHFRSFTDTEDIVLSGPVREVLAKIASPRIGPFYREDLELIHSHVQKEYWQWHESIYGGANAAVGPPSPYKKSKKRKGKGKAHESDAAFTNRDIEDRQDVLRAASRRFASGPTPELTFMTAAAVTRVKASYAYLYDAYHKEFRKKDISLDEMIKKVESTSSRSRVSWSRFPWDVAFRDLCELKAKSLGDDKPVAKAFYECMTVKVPAS